MSTYSVLVCLVLLGLAMVVIAAGRLFMIILGPFTSPLRDLPGPPSSSWMYGNMKELRGAKRSALREAWLDKYGSTFKYKGWLNVDRLYTVDTKAINHILTHSNDYHKPPFVRFTLSQVFGEGLLIAEGEQHRRQRKIMNPAFGLMQIRELTGIFDAKVNQLRDVWTAHISENEGRARVDVLSGLTKTTLDVIGLAGFNYDFDALNNDEIPNELNQAFSTVFNSLTQATNMFRLLKAYLPPLRMVPDGHTRRTNVAQSVVRRIGRQLVAEQKAAVVKATETNHKDLQGRDLLTLLIKANMSLDTPDDQRLSDEEVLARMVRTDSNCGKNRFLVAGHETTSHAAAWCLFALAQDPDVQQKLRNELLSVPDSPSMDELNTLQYLDAVLRETMRVHAPVASTVRIAARDDIIPLNTPYRDMHGRLQDTTRIRKGSPILIPILAVNTSKALWGEDAHAFRPDRWKLVPDAVQNVPGVWGNTLSFLGGTRSCIGYRFALAELKTLIFTLIRAFEFELAVPPENIVKRSAIVQRPYVRTEMENGSQLPLFIRPV